MTSAKSSATKCGSMNRSCSSVPQRTGARRYGIVPEARDQRPQQQLLRQAHPRVRRHLEGAQLEQALPAAGALGRIELVDAELGAVGVAGDVDQRVAEDAIDQPGRRPVARSSSVDLGHRDLELVHLIAARLVDARMLAGRADEHAREQVRQRRMVVPVGDQAAQQVRPPQQRAVARRRPADHDVVAAAGAGVAAVDQELLGAETRLPRFLVERGRVLAQRRPARRRLQVDLDHAGVRRDLDVRQPRIVGRRLAFEDHRQAQRARGRFDRLDQIEVVLGGADRRQEHVQPALARLDAQRGPHDPGGGLRREAAADPARSRVARASAAAVRRPSPASRPGGWPARSPGDRAMPIGGAATAAAGATRRDPARSASRDRLPRATAGCRAAGDTPSASRRGAGRGARSGTTTGRCASAIRPAHRDPRGGPAAGRSRPPCSSRAPGGGRGAGARLRPSARRGADRG